MVLGIAGSKAKSFLTMNGIIFEKILLHTVAIWQWHLESLGVQIANLINFTYCIKTLETYMKKIYIDCKSEFLL
jgi:hypothetical protein